MKYIITIIMISISFLISQQTLFETSFETDPFAEGWTLSTAGAGWIWIYKNELPYASVRTGLYSMGHIDDTGPQDDWLISPIISLPDDTELVLSFWETSMFVQYIGSHEVAVTTDGGNSWSRIISTVPEQYKFTNVFYSLRDYCGRDIQLGWHYTGDYSDQWFVDDVTIFIDIIKPEITKIVSDTSILPVLGTFVNKNMPINLTIADNSGVVSAKGHYSFDGSAVTEIDLYKTKETGLWSCMIPARDSVAEGAINFDITDVAGNTLNSEDYLIKFVTDIWDPEITSIVGTTVQINNDMNLHITLYDHHDIVSCTGHFSKDGFLTQYDFELTRPDIRKLDFYGTIPAESELTSGEVKFIAEDSFGNILNSEKFKVEWISAIPLKFDLRTSLDKNYVTPVKYQFYGTCYDYAANSAIEGNLLMTGNWGSAGEAGVPDLSESHLSWWFGFNQFFNADIDPPTGDGLTTHLRGDYLLVSAYLTRGEGAVREIDASSFTDPPDRFSENYHYYYPRNIEWYTMDNELNGIDLIKQKIMQHGVIGTSLAYDPIFMDQANFTHYQPPDVQYFITHCVSIVGWDDNKVTQAPQGPGAWYCKNSYGQDYGFEGYFWISYYDQHAGKEWEGGTVSFQNVERMKYDAVYYHDYHGWSDTMTDTKEAFNAFTLKYGDNGKLAAVSFYTSIDDVEYSAKVYKSFTDGQLSDELSAVSGRIKYRGFHTVDLTDQPHISKGEKFYIYLSLSQGGQAYDQSSIIPSALTYPYTSSASPGESYYLDNGEWKDLYYNNTIDKPRTANFCIKGLVIRDTVSMDDNLPESSALYQNYPNYSPDFSRQATGVI
jgi:C1A family cysteine protease